MCFDKEAGSPLSFPVYFCKNPFSLKKACTRLTAICLLCAVLFSCTTVDLYEKSVTIPGHKWEKTFRPSFDFTITDTTAPYKVYLVLRHNEKYSFNNIYINLYVKGPGQDTAQKIQRDILLATNEKGWLATGMDDIYEHRSLLAEQHFKAGDYHFSIEHIMRENPLLHVLNAGLRIEKKE